MRELLDWPSKIGIAGLLDIALMACLIYGLWAWLSRTRRAGLILGGISILGAVYLLALSFGLVLTTAILQAFFAIFVIVLVVIFQEELRQLFEQIAKWGLNRAWAGRNTAAHLLPHAEVEVLARTLTDLADARNGALIVLAGQDPVARHVHGGVSVNADLSEALLKSIFDPHSMGHDGAVIIARGRIEKLGVRLPLSRDEESIGPLGTRHAAALGISERTDSLCLVVSEERGTVSMARRGTLQVIRERKSLADLIETHCAAIAPRPRRQPWHVALRRHFARRLASVGIAALLWLALVYRTQVVSEYFTVTVGSDTPPAGLTAVQISPSSVEVRVEGPRRALRRLRPSAIRLSLKADQASPGFQMLPVSEQMINVPEGFRITDIRPRQVLAKFEPMVPSPATRP